MKYISRVFVKPSKIENMPQYVKLQQYILSNNEAALIFVAQRLHYCVTLNTEPTIFHLHAHPQPHKPSEPYS